LSALDAWKEVVMTATKKLFPEVTGVSFTVESKHELTEEEVNEAIKWVEDGEPTEVSINVSC
jgi:hypothetical protein